MKDCRRQTRYTAQMLRLLCIEGVAVAEDTAKSEYVCLCQHQHTGRSGRRLSPARAVPQNPLTARYISLYLCQTRPVYSTCTTTSVQYMASRQYLLVYLLRPRLLARQLSFWLVYTINTHDLLAVDERLLKFSLQCYITVRV